MRSCLLLLMVAALLVLAVPLPAAQFQETGAGRFPVAVGVGWGDYDDDGYADLFVGGYNQGSSYPQTGPHLYHNDQALSFTNVSESLLPGWDVAVEQDGVAWGDYNNDGRLDLLVGSGAGYPMLYRRDPTAFVELGENAGFHVTFSAGRGVAWCDYNGDNLLDAFCSNIFGPGYLMRNNGDGTFTDVSTAAGMSGGALNDQAQSACWGDFDNDGWPDLAVARMVKGTLLYRNNGDGSFADVSVASGVNTAADAFSAVWGDYDNDGWLDLYVTTSAYIPGEQQRDWLFRNGRDGTFTEVGDSSGLAGDTSVGMGAAWGDYDNDGLLDLFVGNSGQSPFLYHNSGTGAFSNDATSGGVAGSGSGGGVSWADIDRDGRLDLVQAVSDTSTRLFHNIGPGGNWLRVRALTSGTGDATSAATPTREATGARVEVSLENDAGFPVGTAFGATLTRVIGGDSGFCGQNEPVAQFGVGASALAAVRVRFPDGSVVVHRAVAANQQIVIRDVPAGRTEIFTDVPLDYWAYLQIVAAKDAGIVAGYGDGTYRPAAAVTRDQMAVYLARALAGSDATVTAPPGPATFPDVPTDYWAYRYIEYCAALGIVQGYWDGYHPLAVVSRAQMAVYVARSIADPTGEEGLDGYTPPVLSSFPDVPTDYWAYKHIEYCKAQGIVSGYWDGYHPEDTVTRDQMAVYIARAFALPG